MLRYLRYFAVFTILLAVGCNPPTTGSGWETVDHHVVTPSPIDVDDAGSVAVSITPMNADGDPLPNASYDVQILDSTIAGWNGTHVEGLTPGTTVLRARTNILATSWVNTDVPVTVHPVFTEIEVVPTASGGYVGSPVTPQLEFITVDRHGTPMEGITVSFTVSPGGSVDPQLVSDQNGMVSPVWILGNSVMTQYTLEATAPGADTVTVVVTAIPSAPEVTVVGQTATSISYEGSSPGTGGAALDETRWQVYEEDGTTLLFDSGWSASPLLSHQATGLGPGTPYLARVRYRYSGGIESPWSDLARGITDGAWLEEDFGSYTDAAELITDPHGIYRSQATYGQAFLTIDADPSPHSSQYLRIQMGDTGTGNCLQSGAVFGLDAAAPSAAPIPAVEELYVEYYVRYSADFADQDWECSAPGEPRFVYDVGSGTNDGLLATLEHFDVAWASSVQTWNASGGFDDASVAPVAAHPLPLGSWVQVRIAAARDGAGDPVVRKWIDGTLVAEYGPSDLTFHALLVNEVKIDHGRVNHGQWGTTVDVADIRMWRVDQGW